MESFFAGMRFHKGQDSAVIYDVHATNGRNTGPCASAEGLVELEAACRDLSAAGLRITKITTRKIYFQAKRCSDGVCDCFPSPIDQGTREMLAAAGFRS